MIVLFKKGETYKSGGVFPVISLPVEAQGEKKDFNDFQWWAPTDKWNSWLKSHPKSWQAESEETEKDFRKRLYESLVKEGEIDTKVLDFSSFNSLLEADAKGSGSSVKVSSAEQPSESEKKNYTKFVFAYNKLKEGGKIKEDLNTSSLKKGEEYAIIWDLPGNDGSPVVETRQAYKSKIITELNNGILVKIDESIPFGKFEEGSDAGNTLLKIAGFGAQILAGGLTAVAAIGGGIWATKSIASRLAARKSINGGVSWLSRIVGGGAEKAVASSAPSASANAAAATELELATGVGAESLGTAGATEVAVGAAVPAAAEGGAGAGALAAAESNPVGWIITAAVVAAGTIQRLINWTSDAQAPRLGEIEDEGWARDSFAPGTIPDGEAITICWTQDAGNNWFTDILWNEDTRTTMDLIKLGNFKGRSIFLMVQINSKEYDAVLKSKEMVLLSFDQNAKFERGYFDNDDLEFEMITVEKGESNNIISTIFEGYCSWEEMEGAYRGADDTFVGVPDNAPDEYSFHYKFGKGDKDINVTGTLIKDIGSLDVMKTTFVAGKPAPNESVSAFKLGIDWKKISESDGVLSFSDFSKLPLTAVPTFEAEGDETSATKTDPEKENKYLTQTEKIAAYEVTSIEFADKALEGQQLPDLKTFIVPNNYLEATDNEEIVVQPVQDVTLKYPRRGTIAVESEAAPEPVPVGATGEPEVEGGVPVEVTTDEVKIKYKDNPDVLNKVGIDDSTKIKDKDREDKIKFLDMITPEEKKDLGIEDWDWIKKVKIYKDGKTGEPYLIKFKSGGLDPDRRRKITAEDSNFDTALKVANRIQAGFKQVEDKDSEEK
jgi:hypothetical protein